MAEPTDAKTEGEEESIQDEALRLAHSGDLSRIPGLLSGYGVLALEPKEHQALIRKCVAACSRTGTPQFVDALFRSMLEFDAALLLRAQTQALYQMKRADERTGPTVGQLPREAVEEIERVGRIEERIVYLAQNFGKAQRSGAARRGGPGGKAVLRMTDYRANDDGSPATGGE